LLRGGDPGQYVFQNQIDFFGILIPFVSLVYLKYENSAKDEDAITNSQRIIPPFTIHGGQDWACTGILLGIPHTRQNIVIFLFVDHNF